MPSLAERQSDFAAALLDAARPVPPGLDAPAGAIRADRFAVYRNNVAVGLIEALRASFPVVDQLVGADFFTAMARAHALESPPASPVLLAYGGDFPAFIARFAPAEALPYLADVAAFEWLWLETYHAADAEPLAVEDLHAIAPARLPDLRLDVHPAARWRRFAHPALSIWRHHQDGEGEGELLLGGAAECALFVRPHAAVSVIDLSPGALALLDDLRGGATLAEAVASALDVEPGLDLGALLPLLFAAGAFAGAEEEGKTL